MKAIERLYQYFDFKGIKPTRFEKNIGVSNGYFGTQKKRNADLGESIIIKIVENSLDLDLRWLLTGEGSMIKSKEKNISKREDEKDTYIIELQKEQIENLKEKIKQLKKVQEPHTGYRNVAEPDP